MDARHENERPILPMERGTESLQQNALTMSQVKKASYIPTRNIPLRIPDMKERLTGSSRHYSCRLINGGKILTKGSVGRQADYPTPVAKRITELRGGVNWSQPQSREL